MITVVIDALRTVKEKLENYLRIIAIPDDIPSLQKTTSLEKVSF